jgi:GWxTD domain-containing protein
MEQVIRQKAAQDYLALDDSARANLERTHWRLADPLFLTEANEVWLEHMSRVAYAELRFSEPERGLRGWETDRGVTYIRYGPPEIVANIPINTTGLRTELPSSDVGWSGMAPRSQQGRNTSVGSTIVWKYDDNVVFMYHQEAGYSRAEFSGDYTFIADEVRYAQPSKYDNIPSLPALFTVPMQIARFRGVTPQLVAVEIHSQLPLEDLLQGAEMGRSQLETGLFLVNSDGDKVLRQSSTEIYELGDAASANPLRSWRLMLPASGTLVAAVEVRDAITWHAAASRDTFTAVPFPEDSLSVSDILLAEALRPLAPEPKLRADYDIVPNPSHAYATNQPVTIYYELYGLDLDSEGFADFDISITVRVRALHREGMIDQLVGTLADAWGFSIAGDDRVELQYHRQMDIQERDRVIEHLTLDIHSAPPGEYEITIKIWDRLAEELASGQRSFVVVE